MYAPERVRTASPYFIYEASIELRPRQSTAVTIVYCSSTQIIPRDIGNALAAHFETATFPQQIWLLGPSDTEESLNAAVKHPDLLDRVPAITRYYKAPAVIVGTIDIHGLICLHVESPIKLDRRTSDTVFGKGLVEIFRTHDGVINASAGYHYVKPSGKHSDAFLRTANVLKYGNEISFIAAALLSHLPDPDIQYIYTDTASINSLAYSLAEIIGRLRPASPRPSIDSFGSYAGINGAFEIEKDTASVALISASTSGAIVDQIEQSQKLPRHRQIILYFVGKRDDSIKVLCDLTEGQAPLGYMNPIRSWKASDCPLCQGGQSTVHVGGDQFLPANPTVSSRMITAKDAPDWLSPLMKSVYGYGVVACHTTVAGSDDPFRTIFFDLSRIIDDPDNLTSDISNKLSKTLIRHIPAATKWLVHLDDRDSLLLAQRIRTELNRLGVRLSDEHIVNAKDLSTRQRTSLGDGVAVIVASAVVTGRSILSLSRSLRRAHEGNPLVFLILVARMQDEAQWKELSVNLTYGNSNPKEHGLFCVESIHLPPDSAAKGTPWYEEAKLWRRLRDDATPFNGSIGAEDLIRSIEQRLEVIEASPAVGGLTSSLFLEATIDGEGLPLHLQPNFAFWDFSYSVDPNTDGRIPTQADVFLTVSAILHNLRLTRKTKHAALSHDHNWTVIAPRNFARFNDAIIQASLLRAALPRELDYSSDETLSLHMFDVIQETLTAVGTEEGAASAEFLLALVLGRVRLGRPDIQRLLTMYSTVAPTWPVLHQVLWNELENTYSAV